MNVTLAYLGHSQLRTSGKENSLSFAPNLIRDPVSFNAPLLHPVRFREAISALHDVVVSDLRFEPRDKTAYDKWKQQQAAEQEQIRRAELQRAKEEIKQKHGEVPAQLQRDYNTARKRYWSLRNRYSNKIRREDPLLWRLLMPCDPVITVSNDVVFFECFSADESSYGCLTVNREDSFGRSSEIQCGTTNVDYSWDLFDHFQSLRTYRETRLHVDPRGFEIRTEGNEDYREEKIDLPSGWLRGFMQIQGAMTLPMRRVTLSREAVYSILAWYRRHKARSSPRAMRFELRTGDQPEVVLEPWEQRIVSRGVKYDGPAGEPVRIWGIRRLQVLARTLPLADSYDVYLLGTGLPSFWVANMGDMRLTLGLSGWTTNDWTRGSALDLLAPPVFPNEQQLQRVAREIRLSQALRFSELRSKTLLDPSQLAGTLNRLAHCGQIIYDLQAEVYRWRQVMPRQLGEEEMGPEDPQLVASRGIGVKKVDVTSQQTSDQGETEVQAVVDKLDVVMRLDPDGRIRQASCPCNHHRAAGLRKGPCRHLLALRRIILNAQRAAAGGADWYQQIQKWAGK